MASKPLEIANDIYSDIQKAPWITKKVHLANRYILIFIFKMQVLFDQVYFQLYYIQSWNTQEWRPCLSPQYRCQRPHLRLGTRIQRPGWSNQWKDGMGGLYNKVPWYVPQFCYLWVPFLILPFLIYWRYFGWFVHHGSWTSCPTAQYFNWIARICNSAGAEHRNSGIGYVIKQSSYKN